MESTSYVLSFRMVFFYLVTTGWVFDISLRENSINQSSNQRNHLLIIVHEICLSHKKKSPFIPNEIYRSHQLTLNRGMKAMRKYTKFRYGSTSPNGIRLWNGNVLSVPGILIFD